jgi:glutaredoxin 3
MMKLVATLAIIVAGGYYGLKQWCPSCSSGSESGKDASSEKSEEKTDEKKEDSSSEKSEEKTDEKKEESAEEKKEDSSEEKKDETKKDEIKKDDKNEENKKDKKSSKEEKVTKKVVIYTKKGCSFCDKAKDLLKKMEVDSSDIEEIELNEENADKIQEMVDKSGGQKTVPQIFINGKHIEGGFAGLQSLEKSGELKVLLKKE